jgi:cytochrome c biogenesis protein CcmG/thiol:disulfide interchange protein DsbE
MSVTIEGSVGHDPQELDQTQRPPSARRPWVVAGVVLIAVALLGSLLSFGLSRDPAVLRSPLIGRAAPDFTLQTLDDSRTVRLSDLRGQVVVINFWASWCRDCRVEHPALTAAWQRYRDSGAVVLGVAFQDRMEDSTAFARELSIDYPLLRDPDSRTALAYGVYGIPETFFVGPSGRVAHKHIGAVPYEVLSGQITRLLNERGEG